MCDKMAADSKELAGAPEAKIEVTPEMVRAGFAVLRLSGITDDPLEADILLVEKIYRAMCACCPRRRQ
jgi:hypothetical protein